jgi:DNA-binding MarR family transcriptional regulator
MLLVMPEKSEVGEALWLLLSAIIRQYPRDLSLTTMSTLRTLERGGPRRLTDLAGVEQITQPSMTVLVGQLEKLGLAERRRDPRDGRGVLVAITPAGRAYMLSHRQAGAAALASLIDHLPSREAGALAAAAPAVHRLADLANRVDPLVPAEGPVRDVMTPFRDRRRKEASGT